MRLLVGYISGLDLLVNNFKEILNMGKYRKKPIMIEAVQWSGKNIKELSSFTGKDFYQKEVDIGTTDATVKTLEGELRAGQFDYIIKGVKGEHYPCKPDIFNATYEKIEN